MVAIQEQLHEDSEASVVDEGVRRVYRMLDDALGSIGGIAVAAGVCGIDRGDLRRALDRNGRRMAVEHVMAINARLFRYNASLATKIGSALVEAANLDVFPRVTLTDKERADRLERLGETRHVVVVGLKPPN
jgi:hypothetical protein